MPENNLSGRLTVFKKPENRPYPRSFQAMKQSKSITKFEVKSMDDIPMGFAMTLAQNEKALAYFGTLDENAKKQMIERAHQIRSKQEMRDFVAQMQDEALPLQ